MKEVKDKKSEWKVIGSCGVDSGQLLIMDPGYINSQLSDKDFVDHRGYKDTRTGKSYKFREGDFIYYDSKISDCDNLTPNQLIEEGIWVSEDSTNPNILKEGEKESYASICQGTIDSKTYQMRHQSGEEGLGVAFSAGFGDGTYDVEARFYEGRVAEIRIIMIEDEDTE